MPRRQVLQATDAMTGAQIGSKQAQPNVLVAHLRDGIEVVGLQTGHTLCKLHLASPGIHTDLNGDGVLDHIQAVGVLPHLAISGFVLVTQQGRGGVNRH